MSPNLPAGYHLVEGIPDDRYPEWLDRWLGTFSNPVSADPVFVDFYRNTHPPSRGVAVDSEDGFVNTNMSIDRDMAMPGGRTVPTASCTGGSSHPAVARQGLMRATAQHLVRRAADEGKAIVTGGASEWQIYGRFGSGPLSWADAVEVDTKHAGLREEVPGADLRVRPVSGEAAKALAEKLFAAQGGATPGDLLHPPCYWDRLTHDPSYVHLESTLAITPFGAGPRNHVAVGDRGLVTYRVIPNWTAESAPHCTLHIVDFLAADIDAQGALWRHLFSVDLVREIHTWRLPVDSPLRWWVRDARRIKFRRQDGLWVRALDIPRLLTARTWGSDGVLTLSVRDGEGYAQGTWRLTVEAGEATCTPTTGTADLTMDVDVFGMIMLGGTPATTLARAGRIDSPDPRCAQRYDAMAAAARAPYLSYWF